MTTMMMRTTTSDEMGSRSKSLLLRFITDLRVSEFMDLLASCTLRVRSGKRLVALNAAYLGSLRV